MPVEVKSIDRFHNEMVNFRLYQMPCCGWFLCWVNPKHPRFCPNCGKNVLLEIMSGEHTRIADPEAWLRRRWA